MLLFCIRRLIFIKYVKLPHCKHILNSLLTWMGFHNLHGYTPLFVWMDYNQIFLFCYLEALTKCLPSSISKISRLVSLDLFSPHIWRTYINYDVLTTYMTYLYQLWRHHHIYDVPISTMMSSRHIWRTFINYDVITTYMTYLYQLWRHHHIYDVPISTMTSSPHIWRTYINYDVFTTYMTCLFLLNHKVITKTMYTYATVTLGRILDFRKFKREINILHLGMYSNNIQSNCQRKS